MKIKALKSIFDTEEGKVYDVIKLGSDGSHVSFLDDQGELMFLFNNEDYEDEFEVVEE